VKLPRRPASAAVAATPSHPAPTPSHPAAPSPDLVAQRDRLTERFALMQSELGGLFYEMAIRDHVKMEVLIEKAAALQRVDVELAQLDHLLHDGDGAIGGHCSNCGTAHARGAAFCSQCAAPLGGT
jgi:hypothetical protein